MAINFTNIACVRRKEIIQNYIFEVLVNYSYSLCPNDLFTQAQLDKEI